MSEYIKQFMKSDFDIHILRLSVIIVFALFGTYKWFDFEVQALRPIIEPTWLNILYLLFGIKGASYFLGVVETITFISLLIGFKKPCFGVVGAVLCIVTGLTTLSLLPQLGRIDSFIIKDVLLIGAGLVILKYDLKRTPCKCLQ